MRIAILADVHANLPAFAAVLADASARECERIYHAGDLISIGPYPSEVVDLAMSAGVKCVLGNHEEWVVKGLPLHPIAVMHDDELMHQHWTQSRLDGPRREFIRSMPYVINETIAGVRVRIVHFALTPSRDGFQAIQNPGLPDPGILGLFDTAEADLICFGHLHPRQFNACHAGCHFLDPGSVGCSLDGLAHYATVDFADGSFEIAMQSVPYDRRELIARYDRLEIPARDFVRKRFLGVKQGEQAPPAYPEGRADAPSESAEA